MGFFGRMCPPPALGGALKLDLYLRLKHRDLRKGTQILRVTPASRAAWAKCSLFNSMRVNSSQPVAICEQN